MSDWKQTLRGLVESRAFPRNAWISVGPLEVYFRSSTRRMPDRTIRPVLDLASVEVQSKHRGQKVFTGFLEELELLVDELGVPLYIENVIPQDFREFFQKRGYTELQEGDLSVSACFLRENPPKA